MWMKGHMDKAVLAVLRGKNYFVSTFSINLNFPVPSVCVQWREFRNFAHGFNKFIYSWDRVRIFFYEGIELPVLFLETECSVFLWAKHGGCCPFSLRWLNYLLRYYLLFFRFLSNSPLFGAALFGAEKAGCVLSRRRPKAIFPCIRDAQAFLPHEPKFRNQEREFVAMNWVLFSYFGSFALVLCLPRWFLKNNSMFCYLIDFGFRSLIVYGGHFRMLLSAWGARNCEVEISIYLEGPRWKEFIIIDVKCIYAVGRLHCRDNFHLYQQINLAIRKVTDKYVSKYNGLPGEMFIIPRAEVRVEEPSAVNLARLLLAH